MSITLFCLVKGNTTTNAFPIHIDKGQFVGDLKKAIKAEKQNDFAGVDADKLRLWKVEIGGDHLDDPLKNLKLNDNNELSAINEIGDYWTEKPPKKHIHVLVEPPASNVASSREQELLIRIAALEEKLSKSEYVFDIVVSPKRTKSFKWTVNIEEATLVGLKEYIREEYNPATLENDGAVLRFVSNDVKDAERHSPRNDQDFCKMLRQFVSKDITKFTVVIETPSKAFSDWSFPKVCQLYGLGESDDPSLSVFPPFTCEYKELNDDSSQEILRNLITELNARLKTIPISGNEASKSQYVCSYLVAGANLHEGKFELRPEKNITGPNGHGPVDFAIDLLQTAKTVGVTEVKDEDIFKGIAQNAVQLESALSNRKRKASEMEEDNVFVGKTFGIITDAKEWYFMECSLDDQDRLKFKLSKPVTVVYDSENMGGNVKRVLGHIAWLLEEVQKPDSASQSEERAIKKPRSSGNLTENSLREHS
ncbi:Coronin-like protein crn1 [Rhizophagus irregularis]|uniref:Crinkler effector protein N-terminal domain-containing protein n=4 Tax=Rhizophagus irregularis TaxID=588596 RepID=A0A015JNP8_RHIIW|nr:crinkler effector protein [Rhizophagus irregularis]EXX68830.1 hypothetical protein RirG_101490 [Rhizophagus irregularis DAOM 197198w]EXX68835.1 hypothetical protein RirG_101540 [Rhizophagus irregularis DAOM 197198w]UZO08239.1 Coronin-like protein crn1 [Rhizophagus irregularis]